MGLRVMGVRVGTWGGGGLVFATSSGESLISETSRSILLITRMGVTFQKKKVITKMDVTFQKKSTTDKRC